MQELEKVCKELLDNADLDVELENKTSSIRLKFTTGNKEGELVEVFFECKNFCFFKMAKNSEDEEGFFVGQTVVNKIEEIEGIKNFLVTQDKAFGNKQLPNILYHIKILGGAEIEVICFKFDWRLVIHNHT